jgi:hypothetical protein
MKAPDTNVPPCERFPIIVREAVLVVEAIERAQSPSDGSFAGSISTTTVHGQAEQAARPFFSKTSQS